MPEVAAGTMEVTMKYGTIGVVGAGVMGRGLAQTLAQTGHRVILIDVADAILARARTEILKQAKFAALFDPVLRQTSETEIIERIEFGTSLARLASVDFVIENTTESWPVKAALYPQLDRICRPECVIAANTSAIAITRLAERTTRPDQVIGMHFMNPVSQKPVVEVVKGRHTSDATLAAAGEVLTQMNKQAIVVNDMPGFVSNRVLMLAINEAISVVESEVAAPEDVDAIFVKCLSHKMGPLATADLIGLDTVLLSLEVLADSFEDDKFRPCPLLRKMVEAGLHGRKSGQGFFAYAE